MNAKNQTQSQPGHKLWKFLVVVAVVYGAAFAGDEVMPKAASGIQQKAEEFYLSAHNVAVDVAQKVGVKVW